METPDFLGIDTYDGSCVKGSSKFDSLILFRGSLGPSMVTLMALW